MTNPTASEAHIEDRIKFWKEQDRINKALIPRVVTVYETTRELAELLNNALQRLAAAEAKQRSATIGTQRMSYLALTLAILALALELIRWTR